jgi:hypothetical protein
MKQIAAIVLFLALLPTSALAQPAGMPQVLPMVVDLRKVAVGSWAEYKMHLGDKEMKTRWAMVGRDSKSITLEMTMDGVLSAQMGGRVTMKMVLDPDPINAPKPLQELLMQMGDGIPVVVPQGAQARRFEKPDAKTLVGKERIQVAAGTFKTKHYRNNTSRGSIDVWVSDEIPPLGLVKIQTTASGAGSANIPSATLELIASGRGAKPIVTKPAKTLDDIKAMVAQPPAVKGMVTQPPAVQIDK